MVSLCVGQGHPYKPFSNHVVSIELVPWKPSWMRRSATMRRRRTSREHVTVGTPDMRQPANASVWFFTDSTAPSNCSLRSMVLAVGSFNKVHIHKSFWIFHNTSDVRKIWDGPPLE